MNFPIGTRAFPIYEDSAGSRIHGDQLGIWHPEDDVFGCWVHHKSILRFCVETQTSTRRFVGRERYNQYNWVGIYTLSWSGITKFTPSDIIDHIENHIINIDDELKALTGHKINLNDTDLSSQLHTEIYAPVWQKGSEAKIIQECISDANVILALVKRCSDAGDIRVRLRNEEIPMEFDVEW